MHGLAIAAALAVVAAGTARAEEALVTFRVLSPDMALELARSVQTECRARGYQVAVAVVDRFGVTQVLLRDQFAGAHTPAMAAGKAWTAASFRINTTELARITQPGQPQSGLRHLPNVVAAGGGVVVEAQGSTVGGIGVSGGPSGEADEECALAGIEKLRDKLEF